LTPVRTHELIRRWANSLRPSGCWQLCYLHSETFRRQTWTFGHQTKWQTIGVLALFTSQDRRCSSTVLACCSRLTYDYTCTKILSTCSVQSAAGKWVNHNMELNVFL
jgi:hypothetical protein